PSRLREQRLRTHRVGDPHAEQVVHVAHTGDGAYHRFVATDVGDVVHLAADAHHAALGADAQVLCARPDAHLQREPGAAGEGSVVAGPCAVGARVDGGAHESSHAVRFAPNGGAG